ncbi:MAG: aminofutalosine synthase MqnE [Candidatus Abyssobacteria bacterium SURF_17]|jgi:aminodeoxyfutalosine synthase|uniref:Aminodeoxyfutalosine synthase n=1 Tax=Candidatus Abyssobacteria bacterium SURF_17 TaxID=2093361 RepID=A0A419EWP7_9BACT|nr:MAG: aminofutalosine synthase MqnE [Candidatus Abyssubacteria bacterium SURF_17]
MITELIEKSEVADVYHKVQEGRRLSREDGMRLYRTHDILTLGHMANIARERKNGGVAYYIVNFHINYSNICKNKCRFCAFSRKGPEEDGAYEMTMDEIMERAKRVRTLGATEIHIVGGAHPSWPFSRYLEMIGKLHDAFPDVHLQAFTAVEIAHIAEMAGLSVTETLDQLKKAGLGSLPGGGAEVFSQRVRAEVCPEKLSAEKWLEVMREAHRFGLRSNATMLYGHIETEEERIDHMLRLRELQDETDGFMSFIPLAFHPANTQMSDKSPTTGFLDLKTLAIGRLMLDNFEHIKAFWIMLGIKLAQVSLWFGVDDIDGTVVEERITHAAGAETPQGLTVEELKRLIVEAGRVPVERDTLYRVIRRGIPRADHDV